jgi:four helix bundle protein
MIKTVFDLDVFKLSYQNAMNIFKATRTFPKEEKYSLTDQIIRSSRSVSANIAEGWGKRVYENEFKSILCMQRALWRKQKYGYTLPKIVHT